MKYFFLIFGSLLVGGVTLAVFFREAGEKPFVRNGQQEAAIEIQKAIREAAAERAENREQAEIPTAFCAHDTFDFGLMDPLTVGQHEFVIENRSAVPLLLSGGGSTCKCTLSDLKEAIVAESLRRDRKSRLLAALKMHHQPIDALRQGKANLQVRRNARGHPGRENLGAIGLIG